MTNLLHTHRSALQRLRLLVNRQLGAGDFFWHAWATANVRERNLPIVFHMEPGPQEQGSGEPVGLSLDDLRLRVIRYAHWYRGQGVGPKSHVGVYTRAGVENLLHYIAVTSLGAVPVHANAAMPADTAADYFRRTRVTVLVGDRDLVQGCTAVWKETAPQDTPAVLVEDTVLLRDSAPKPPHRLEGFPYRHADADLVLISHSSGTTGRPKAPVFTHRSFFAGRWDRLFAFPSHRTDKLLSVFPHSHSAGLAHLSMAILLGLPTLLLDDVSGPSVVRAVNTFRPTMVIGFPIALAGLRTADITPEAARTVHTWCGMGDASHERHIRPLIALGSRATRGGRLPGSDYLDGLGSSEMGMVLFEQVHNAEIGIHRRLVGRPTKVVSSAVVLDEAGRELPAGQPGMLGVRAPSVTPGYWDDPGLTERSMRDGHFLTGDIVEYDEQGLWYHLDRVPDVINSGTGPVYSLPLEEVVLLETGALDCAVFAVDDPDLPGISCPAVVVLPEDIEGGLAAPPPGELLARCNGALRRAGLAELRALVVATERAGIPVGPTGKVLKRRLRERHARLLASDATPGPDTAVVPERTRA
ncbi:class I adenylate-forming enzyme family protein [Streptomyces sp. NPDC005953]|uniref:class I adenylate-forming enzyme family protein n=1 Tax=Streptomyces sp. NPDC005953 TaxID=3156719 RepID=UPI0033EA84C3